MVRTEKQFFLRTAKAVAETAGFIEAARLNSKEVIPYTAPSSRVAAVGTPPLNAFAA
jgi:hypothetical protein